MYTTQDAKEEAGNALAFGRGGVCRPWSLLPLAISIAIIVFVDAAVADVFPSPLPACQREMAERQQRMFKGLSRKQINLYLDKAESGDRDAMFLLSQIPNLGPDGQPDFEFTRRWRHLALVAGHPALQASQAREAYERGELPLPGLLKQIESSAAAGTPGTAYMLGNAYLHWQSRGALPEIGIDRAKGMYWYEVAAGQGDAQAVDALCMFHFNGDRPNGIEPNYAAAARWCAIAAQLECSPLGASHLAELFAKGLGVPKNFVQAEYWKQVAAERRLGSRRNN